MRKGRSERTQEFGDWYEMYDKAIDSVFYVNDRFNKTQWKSPFSSKSLSYVNVRVLAPLRFL